MIPESRLITRRYTKTLQKIKRNLRKSSKIRIERKTDKF